MELYTILIIYDSFSNFIIDSFRIETYEQRFQILKESMINEVAHYDFRFQSVKHRFFLFFC